MDKKANQLGMNPSTASHRLVKDILFKFVIDSGHVCFHCGEDLTRETFSIEHMEPWLDTDRPAELFFDLSNIAFSHLRCNIKASRPWNKKHYTEKARKEANAKRERHRWGKIPEEQRKAIRKAKYKKHGV